jgi:hypothetical protein
MSPSQARAPTQEEALRLHHRLLDGDPTAAHDLIVAYLEPLVDWLGGRTRACRRRSAWKRLRTRSST